ncbi:MAG TPA: beta-propeller fold lactonase family protein [Xanthobacteraceae bacterium]
MAKHWITMAKLGFVMLLMIGTAGTAAADNRSDSGAVYTMTNSTTGNAVVVYARAADGTLMLSGTFPTGGTSIGFFATGNQNGVLLSDDGHCLWAVNSMSNSISAFKVKGTSLSLINVIGSGGQRPISLAVNEDLGILYVLNAGGQIQHSPQYSDNVKGFTLGEDCALSSLPGSTRALNAPTVYPGVSPAQVSFNPAGSVLVVTEKTNNGGVRGGNIVTFIVRGDGLLTSPKSFAMPCGTGNTACPVTEPFGFAFDNSGQLLVTAADCTTPALPGNLPGCTVPPDQPSLLSYTLTRDGTLTLVDALADNQAAKCWIVITNSQQRDGEPSQKDHGGLNEFAFTVNAIATQAGGTPGSPPAGSVTGYQVSPGGSLTDLGVTPIPLEPVGVPVDAALSRNSRFLYVLSEGDGSISAFKVGLDGSLTLLNTYAVTTPPAITTNGPFPNGLAAR